jgi:hypothetical protein
MVLDYDSPRSLQWDRRRIKGEHTHETCGQPGGQAFGHPDFPLFCDGFVMMPIFWARNQVTENTWNFFAQSTSP